MQKSFLATLIFYLGVGIVLCIFGFGLYSACKLDVEYAESTILYMAKSAFLAIVFLYAIYKIALGNFKS